jgi:hypothetical protein
MRRGRLEIGTAGQGPPLPVAGHQFGGVEDAADELQVALQVPLILVEVEILVEQLPLPLGWSRHEETPRRRLIEWTADGTDYQVLAETGDGEFDRGWSALRRVLSAVEGPQTAAAILRQWPADAPPPSRATLHRWLARAVQRGWLCGEASHRRNAPYRYWLPPAKES